MELIKRMIHGNRQKCQGNIQITLDDDFNVPDRKPDIVSIIQSQGEVRTNEIKVTGDRACVDGILSFHLLYASDQGEGKIQSMDGEIPFQEWINLDEGCSGGNVMLFWNLEDLNAELINSRKISVRAVVLANFSSEDSLAEEIGTDVEEEDIQTKKEILTLTQLKISKKDTFRIKDEYILPSAKPDIRVVLYEALSLRQTEIRLSDDKISIKGELHLFCLYMGDEQERVEYIDTDVSFGGMVDCLGLREEMTPDIDISIQKQEITVKPDEDGEERVLDLDVILDLGIKAYGEEELELLDDFYATNRKVEPICKKIELVSLKMRNSNKVKLNSRISITDENPGILQLCTASGIIRMDEVVATEGGILAEGVVEIPMLYITAEDEIPISATKGMIPFSELIETNPISEEMFFEVKPRIDQIMISLLDAREAEARVSISLDAKVFEKKQKSVIIDAAEEEFKEEELEKVPGLIGYLTRPGDTLWDIAKRFYTTVEKIKEWNELVDDKVIASGLKLLIEPPGRG